jgi:hypothetical protein
MKREIKIQACFHNYNATNLDKWIRIKSEVVMNTQIKGNCG